MIDTIICGDCLEVMPTIPDKSVDMVLADLPYGVTACKWDTPLPLVDLWKQFQRVAKPNAAMVFTATQPFSSRLVMSKPELYKHEWIWEKDKGFNFRTVGYNPYNVHEHIIIFSDAAATFTNNDKSLNYNPQFEKGKPYNHCARSKSGVTQFKMGSYEKGNIRSRIKNDGLRYPRSVIKFTTQRHSVTPTQKPVALFEYLIRTYTNEGDLVLDPTAGSGTTAVACRKSNRHYICIEKEAEYCAIAEKRLAEML